MMLESRIIIIRSCLYLQMMRNTTSMKVLKSPSFSTKLRSMIDLSLNYLNRIYTRTIVCLDT